MAIAQGSLVSQYMILAFSTSYYFLSLKNIRIPEIACSEMRYFWNQLFY